MVKQNIEEYKLLRRETESIKDCITAYMRFLFIGIGVFFSAWGKFDRDQTIPIAYSTLLISILAVAMLWLLIYKFVSHNRYVGYYMLLSKENWKVPYTPEDSLLIWELCLNEYRVKYITAEIPSIWHSLGYLIRAIYKVPNTKSWAFPVTIIRIFVIIVLPCVVWGGFQTFLQGVKVFNSPNIETVVVLIPLLFFLLFHLLSWTLVAQRLYSLMEGDLTINSFSEGFKQIRLEILKKFGIDAEYI